MQIFGKAVLFLCIAMIAVTVLIASSEASYRKPPFNGSIFGKRTGSTDYDGASKALSSMCEIASEACQTWFPAQEK